MKKKQTDIETDREIFQQLIIEFLARTIDNDSVEDLRNKIVIPDDCKAEMNKYFREVVKNDFVPYPEVEGSSKH
ncbi:MAG: hypothetical protein ACI3X1_00150 [Eubacteriales bacterium]